MEISGSLDQRGHPIFPIKLFGYSPHSQVEIPAMFDTGFTGFLDLPLQYCLRAGLILFTTGNYTLADGRTSSTLLCLGTIVLPEQNVIGAISVSYTNEALLGIEFIKKIQGKLELDMLVRTVKISYTTPIVITPTQSTSVLPSNPATTTPSKK